MNPTPRLGPFELVRPIGRGGMAEVWRAIHHPTGTPVAVKLVTGRTATEPSRVRAFRMEARAMAGLLHPHLILIYDQGEVPETLQTPWGEQVVAGAPWLAMELCSGGTLRSQVGKLEWPQVRGVLQMLLGALAHAHARGVVHLDLKPDNVLLSSPGDLRPGPKLSDFGIARALEGAGSASPVSVDGASGAPRSEGVRGTPSYMAPEQLAGRWRDFGPWTDLYALGCLAWELIAGAPPFTQRTLSDLVMAHLHRPPPAFPAPESLPPGGEAILRRLLAKEPTARFSSCAQVLRALELLPDRVEPSPSRRAIAVDLASFRTSEQAWLPTVESAMRTPPSWSATEPLGEGEEATPFELDPPGEHTVVNPLDHLPLPPSWDEHEPPAAPALQGVGLNLYGLRQPPLVDRRPEREALWAELRRVVEQGHARALVLKGSAGVGKSRLAQALVERAQELGVATGLPVSHSPAGGRGDGLAAMLTRQLCLAGLSGDGLESRLHTTLGRLGASERWEWHALLTMVEARPRRREHVVASVDGAESFAGLRRYLERLASQLPVILWIDDAQWGAEALRFVRWLLTHPSPPTFPLLAVLTVQEGALEERLSAQALLAGLEQLPSVTSCEVPPLGEGEQTRLVGELLPLAEPLREQVALHTRGNPLFAVQLVGDWVERGLLGASPRGFELDEGAGGRWPEDLPQLWTWRIERLLEGRPPTWRTALLLLATLGESVDLAEAACAGGVLALDWPADLVEELLRHRLMVPLPGAAGGGVSFVHEMLREGVLSLVQDEATSQRLHLAAAEMLSQAPFDATPLACERRALHLIEGGRTATALPLLLEACVERMLRGHRIESELLLERFTRLADQAALPEEDPLRLECVVGQAGFLLNRGEVPQSQALARRVLEKARATGQVRLQAQAGRLLAYIAWTSGQPREAYRWYKQALPLCREAAWAEGVAACLLGLGLYAWLRSDNRRALSYAREALAASEEGDVGPVRGECLALLSQIAAHRGELAEARAFNDQACTYAEELGSQGNLAEALARGVSLDLRLGDLVTAEVRARRALDLFERLDMVSGVALALSQLGEALRARGQWEQAREVYERAVALCEHKGLGFGYVSRFNLVWILIMQGEVEAALRQLDRARPEIEKMEDVSLLAGFFVASLWCRVHLGEVALAREALEKARALVAQLEAPELEDVEIIRRAAARAWSLGERTLAQDIRALGVTVLDRLGQGELARRMEKEPW